MCAWNLRGSVIGHFLSSWFYFNCFYNEFGFLNVTWYSLFISSIKRQKSILGCCQELSTYTFGGVGMVSLIPPVWWSYQKCSSTLPPWIHTDAQGDPEWNPGGCSGTTFTGSLKLWPRHSIRFKGVCQRTTMMLLAIRPTLSDVGGVNACT